MEGIRFIDRLAAAGPLPGPVRPPRAAAPAQPHMQADSLQSSLPARRTTGPTFLDRLQVLGTSLLDRARVVMRPGTTGAAPDWRAAGDDIARIAEAHGYRRGQPVRDRQVVDAMLERASQLYGVPAEWLKRLATRESNGQHWGTDGRVREAAAVGLLQIERSAYPDAVRGGEANARQNVYDLGNNIAFAASKLRQQHDRMVQGSGYRGPDSWRQLGPLVEFTYSAGSGALRKAQDIARGRGLDPWNWQHLMFGGHWQVPATSHFRVAPGTLSRGPMATAIDQIHASRLRDGRSNYPRAWQGQGAVARFDFDGNGEAHKVERMLARTLHMVYGLNDPRPQ